MSTLQLCAPSDVTVTVDATTKITPQGKALTFADLKVGDKIVASGTKQSDGSILAEVIEVW